MGFQVTVPAAQETVGAAADAYGPFHVQDPADALHDLIHDDVKVLGESTVRGCQHRDHPPLHETAGIADVFLENGVNGVDVGAVGLIALSFVMLVTSTT